MDFTAEEIGFLKGFFGQEGRARLYLRQDADGHLLVQGWYSWPGRPPPPLAMTFNGEAVEELATGPWVNPDDPTRAEPAALAPAFCWWPGNRGWHVSARVPRRLVEAAAATGRPAAIRLRDAAGQPATSRWDVVWMDARAFLDPDAEPAPPPAMIRRVMGYEDRSDWQQSGLCNLDYVAAGFQQAAMAGLAEVGRVLEWGCGSGRLSRHLIARGVPVAGVDIDAEAIAWCNRHLAPRARAAAEFRVSGLAPPLPYSDATFDAAIGVSVITHLDAEHEAMWLGELARVLRPGAPCVLTVQGFRAFSVLANPRLLRELRGAGASHGTIGHLLDEVLGENQDYYREAFHTEEWIRARWTTHFELVSVLPGAHFVMQDAVVLRRR
ncbi:MAG: class I SAM-dependent methyltransferase [Rhodovarius sp.]|nr:class I SAM-dependent methyltransferase [Rhodovarius sp.]MDW8313380.1 class I SAM-dependent methyltransferase [Rhodovarius sp.]